MDIRTNGQEEWEELEPSDEYFDVEKEIMNTGVKFIFTHKLKNDARWKRIFVRDGDYYTQMSINVGLFKIREEAIMNMILDLFKENKKHFTDEG